MPHTANYRKQIACIESLGPREERKSVRPMLEYIASVQSVPLSFHSCDTEQELVEAFRTLSRLRADGILYLSVHGSTGTISLANGTQLSLEQLADMLGDRFRGWVLLFGSCSTLRASPERLAQLVATTEIPLLLGYRKAVDWIESSAMDMLIFQAAQHYIDVGACWRFLKRQYPDLIERTGLAAYIA
jgi:hypothetical protein